MYTNHKANRNLQKKTLVVEKQLYLFLHKRNYLQLIYSSKYSALLRYDIIKLQNRVSQQVSPFNIAGKIYQDIVGFSEILLLSCKTILKQYLNVKKSEKFQLLKNWNCFVQFYASFKYRQSLPIIINDQFAHYQNCSQSTIT